MSTFKFVLLLVSFNLQCFITEYENENIEVKYLYKYARFYFDFFGVSIRDSSSKLNILW